MALFEFDMNGLTGTPISSITASVGSTITLPNPAPATYPSGFIFGGWTISGMGYAAYAPGSSVKVPTDGTFVVTANFAPVSSKVITAYSNLGDGSAFVSWIPVGQPLTIPTNYWHPSDKSFVVWNTAADGSGTAYAPLETPSISGSSLSIYAQWQVNADVTVTFDPNGGTGVMAPQTSNTITNLTPNTFTRTGYTFVGWSSLPDGTGFFLPDTTSWFFMGAPSLTVYAQWEATSATSRFISPNAMTSGHGSVSGTFQAYVVSAPTQGAKVVMIVLNNFVDDGVQNFELPLEFVSSSVMTDFNWYAVASTNGFVGAPYIFEKYANFYNATSPTTANFLVVGI